MRFSQDFIGRVLEANNIVDMISQYTQLKPSGSGLMGRCPFPDHQEKTASFSVSEHKQVYHCFGCHKKGNLLTFLQNYNGMSFPEAVEYLADRAHIALPAPEKNDSYTKQDQVLEKKKALAKVNQLAAEFFSDQLKRVSADHPVKKYMTQRGLSPEVVEAFGIGYAPNEWDGLEQFLVHKGVSLALAEEAKLIKPRTNGKSGYYDIFRDRLMFPIHSPMGEAVAFGGRIIEQGEPKYLNSPETPVFIKGKILYGLSQTARYIRTEDMAIIVEGYMDLVSLYQAGIRSVVATMGTALTLDHGRLLKRMTRNVVALFDGDSAGMEAAERSLPLLLAADLYPKGLTLPNAMDPDDYVKAHGADALKKALARAPDLFSLILERWMGDYKAEASQKVKLADKLKSILNVIPDQRLKQLYLEEASQKMGVTFAWLKSALGTSPQVIQNPARALPSQVNDLLSASVNPQGPLEASEREEREAKISLKGASKAELMLINVVLKSRANFEFFLKERIFDHITHLGVKKILERAIEVYRQDLNKFDKLVSLLVSSVDQPELLFTSEPAGGGSDGYSEELEMKLLRDCFKRVHENFLREQAKQIAKSLTSETSSEKLEQIMNIQRNRFSLNKGN